MARDRPPTPNDSAPEGIFGKTVDRGKPIARGSTIQSHVSGGEAGNNDFSGKYAGSETVYPQFIYTSISTNGNSNTTVTYTVTTSTGLFGGSYFDTLFQYSFNSATQPTSFNVFFGIYDHDTVENINYALATSNSVFGDYPNSVPTFSETISLSASESASTKVYWPQLAGLEFVKGPGAYERNMIPTLYPSGIQIKLGASNVSADFTNRNMTLLNRVQPINLSPLIR